MIRKGVVIAVLVIFCLTATLFLVKPTGSQTSGQWDPWADVTGPNGVLDGKVDIRDLSYVAKLFGTTGDSTRNVNVTNWPTYDGVVQVNGTDNQLVTVTNTYRLQTGTINFSSNGWTNPTIFCGGYSRLSLMLRLDNTTLSDGFMIVLTGMYWLSSSSFFSPLSAVALSWNTFNITFTAGGGYSTPTPYMTETMAPYCCLMFAGPISPAGWATIDYAVYLRNE